MSNRNKKRKDRVNMKDRRIPNHRSNTKRMTSLSAKVSLGTILSVTILLTAYLYHKYKDDAMRAKLEETLSSLLRAESKSTVDHGTRIAVGFGSCQDLVVQSSHVLKDPAPKYPEHFFSISSKEELLKVFAYFYRHGAAAERYINNATLFEEILSIASRAPSARHIVGGNAAVMANRFVKEGCSVLLGAQMSKTLQDSFPKEVQISGPIVDEDDIHLLLEYPAGKSWGPYTAPRANRFIVHNDHENPLLSSLEIFSHKIIDFDPDLLVVGGLQMMDNFPITQEKRNERLMKVQSLMKQLPRKGNIHFEMASFSDEALLKDLVMTVIPYANSLGMNEQELPNLFQVMKYGNVSLISEPYPRIATILDQMRDVFGHLQEMPENDGRRRLTRLHVHTLAFHALMIDKNSSWKNTLSAIAKSVLTANRHTCGSDNIDIAASKLIMDNAFTTSRENGAKRIPFDPKKPIACWEEENVEVCVAPVLVCTKVIQTGGGGDNISSAGLVLQI